MPVKVEIFKSPTCPHCTPTIELVKNVVEELGKELGNVAEIDIIDVMKHPSKAMKYGIYAVPTVAINGKVQFVGRPNRENLVEAIKREL
ncbi:MAG: MJ0307 family thioredoxin [Candidatus Hydrothermarchaeota archaeon]